MWLVLLTTKNQEREGVDPEQYMPACTSDWCRRGLTLTSYIHNYYNNVLVLC